MAAKKGAQIHFQVDVSTDEEWSKLLERQGLVVIDVYSDWCGPCTAMVSSLKKMKLEIGSDYLHFALAKSNTIETLQRFKDKSEPMWMFVASGHLVNLIFGVDAPKLIQVIKQELEAEINVLEGKAERKYIPFDELTDAERERKAILVQKEQEKLKQAEEKLAEKITIIRERSLIKLSNLIPNHSCIIYFPHMLSADGSCSVAQKMMYLNDSIPATVVDQIQVQLNASAISQVFYKCPVFANIPSTVKTGMEKKPVLVTLLQTVMEENTPSDLSPRQSYIESEAEPIERKLTKMIYGTKNPLSGYTEQSVAYEFIIENEQNEKVPPMWTPVNPISKAAVIEIIFPRKVESIGYVPEKLPPPQLIIIYDATKAYDVMELIKEYKEEVFRVGFFDSVDPATARFVCKTYEQFNTLTEEQKKNVKMVVALKKGETDDVLLTFAQVVPLYISPNEKHGTEESEQFFPYEYDDDDEKDNNADKNKDSDNYAIDKELSSAEIASSAEMDKENINVGNINASAMQQL